MRPLLPGQDSASLGLYRAFPMPDNLIFSEETDSYTIIKLKLSHFQPAARTLPDGVTLAPVKEHDRFRPREKRLLRSNFRHWKLPYQGRLPGWRSDSPILAVSGRELIGGLYACDKDEFDDPGKWGQLHYFFVDPAHRGRGIHSCLIQEAVRRAASWGLDGVYINTDRVHLPDVYVRWGGEVIRRIPKRIRLPKHPNAGPHNWLAYRLHDARIATLLRTHASGVLADVGCGEKPYAALTEGLVSKHIGIDHADSEHGKARVDIYATAYHTTLADSSVNTVLCTTLLEHVERPADAIREMFRILEPGGPVILSAPMFWHLHEEPRDFYRYTPHGMRHLLAEAGFQNILIVPLSGFIVTAALESSYYLQRFRNRLTAPTISALQGAIQLMALVLNRWDRSYAFSWLHVATARKPLRVHDRPHSPESAIV